MKRNGLNGQVTQNELNVLLREVLSSYKTEVLEGGKLHHLFAKDFLNSHHHTDRRDTKGMNEHRKNLGILESILATREDLLRLFSVEDKPDSGKLESLLHLYYTTNPPPRGQAALASESDGELPPRPLSLGCSLNDDQMSLIAHCVNEARLFEEVVDIPMLRSLLEGKLSTPLHSRNNRLLAFFFDQLCQHRLILSRWQHLLEQAGSILGSNDGRPLRHAQLSNALTRAKSNPNSMQERIRHYVRQVLRKGENTNRGNK